MSCEHGDGIHASLVTAAAASSDNAARATSRKLQELKAQEIAFIKSLSDQALAEAPNQLVHAAQAWLKSSPEQRKVAEKLHELGCSGHSINLTLDDSHRKTEREVLEANVVRDLAANIIANSHFLAKYRRERRQQGLAINYWACRTGCRFLAGDSAHWSKDPGDERADGRFLWKWNHEKERKLSLVPGGKYLDGSDLPDIASILITLSKAFALHGAVTMPHIT